MHNWIHCFVHVFFLSALRERRRGGEFLNFKVGVVEMRRALPLCSLWSYLCSMMSSDKRVFGKVNAQHPHTQTAIQLFPPTVSPPSVLKYCLSALALNPVLIVVCSFSSIRGAFCSPSPVDVAFSLSWLSLAYAHVSPGCSGVSSAQQALPWLV